MTVLLVSPAATAAPVDETTATIRIIVVDAGLAPVAIDVSSDREPHRHWSAVTAATGHLGGLPPGRFHVRAAAKTGASAQLDVTVSAGERISLSVHAGSSGALEISVVDRDAATLGLDEHALAMLPAGSGLWGLVDAASPFVVSDRLDTGGLSLGLTPRVAGRAASWMTSVVSTDGAEVARGPSGSDELAWQPVVAALESVRVVPGSGVVTSHRRPGPHRQSSLDVS